MCLILKSKTDSTVGVFSKVVRRIVHFDVPCMRKVPKHVAAAESNPIGTIAWLGDWSQETTGFPKENVEVCQELVFIADATVLDRRYRIGTRYLCV
jgi:hypothetical protein